MAGVLSSRDAGEALVCARSPTRCDPSAQRMNLIARGNATRTDSISFTTLKGVGCSVQLFDPFRVAVFLM